jgi:hypothetical protein
LPVSPVTFALSVAWDPVVSAAGGAEEMLTTIGAVVTIFAVAKSVIAGLVVDAAVIVTVKPEEAPEGPT